MPRRQFGGGWGRRTCSGTRPLAEYRRGVPEAQIAAAAGHVGEGTGKRNYRYLHPDYLGELMEAVDAYWAEIARYTTVHLRSQNGPKVVNFASARATARIKGK